MEAGVASKLWELTLLTLFDEKEYCISYSHLVMILENKEGGPSWPLLGERENRVPIRGIIAATVSIGPKQITTNVIRSQEAASFVMNV